VLRGEYFFFANLQTAKRRRRGGTVRRRGVSSRGEHDEIAFADRRLFLAGAGVMGFERGDVSNRLSDRRPNWNFHPSGADFSP
jgi:hypothetical protein